MTKQLQSEVELTTMRNRLERGKLHKAKRGLKISRTQDRRAGSWCGRNHVVTEHSPSDLAGFYAAIYPHRLMARKHSSRGFPAGQLPPALSRQRPIAVVECLHE